MENLNYTPPQIVLPPPMTDEQAMDHAQQLRLSLISQLMPGGKIPADTEVHATLMKAIDGLDKQAIAKKRLIVDDKKADNEKEAARLVNEALRMMGGHRVMKDINPEVKMEPPRLPDSIPDPILVDGEMDATSKPLTFDAFMAQQSDQ